MTFRISSDGTVLCLWTDRINLRRFGTLKVRRASTIEFDHRRQQWAVVVRRRVLFRNPDREVCVKWERRNDHRILDLALQLQAHASKTKTTASPFGRRRPARNTSATRGHNQSSGRLSGRRGASRR